MKVSRCNVQESGGGVGGACSFIIVIGDKSASGTPMLGWNRVASGSYLREGILIQKARVIDDGRMDS